VRFQRALLIREKASLIIAIGSNRREEGVAAPRARLAAAFFSVRRGARADIDAELVLKRSKRHAPMVKMS